MAAVNREALGVYQRHQPQQGLFYRVIETYWPLFLREQQRVGKTLPKFIVDEFEEGLKCGIPEHGFVRTYCHQCRYSGIVAFSCKKRGFCPSCTARRMSDEASHIVDRVLPQNVPIRQWVLSFPYKIRFLMAHNPRLTGQILRVYLSAVSSSLKKRAKRSGIKSGRPGSVTFIQRFGSALNLNPHFHTLFVDGVFHKTGEGYEFFRLPAPSEEELLAISIDHVAAFGERAGGKLKRYGTKNIESDPENHDPYSVNVEGFSLNARVWIWSGDKEKLEKLIRYTARGPVATDRLFESFPNLLLYRMKTRWRDGTTHVCFSYLDFIARLVALIPPPRMNMVRYHGVFAPNFKDRRLIVPKPLKDSLKGASDRPAVDGAKAQGVGEDDRAEGKRRERMRWSEMLKRTFEIDVTVCPQCSGRLEQIAVIRDKAAAGKILKSMGQVTEFRRLEIVKERGPPADTDSDFNDFDQHTSW